MSIYKATDLITEAFDEAGINYRVCFMEDDEDQKEWVEAAFTIDGGPAVVERFFVTDNSNDVAVRVLALINKVPVGKRNRIIAACNGLNAKLCYFKFFLNEEGNVDVTYDFPSRLSDEDTGPVAVEIFIRTMSVLNHHYDVLMETLYGHGMDDEDSEDSRTHRLLMFQEALRTAIEGKNTAGHRFDEAEAGLSSNIPVPGDEAEDDGGGFEEAEG